MTFFCNEVWKLPIVTLLNSGTYKVADVIDKSSPTY